MDSATDTKPAKTILVVDDDLDLLALVQDFLVLRGFRVISASSVQDCFRELSRHKPRILLVDYALPDGTGLDIIDKAINDLPDLAVIVMTGVAIEDVEVATHAMKSGAIEYLTKPFSLEVLESVIQRSMLVQELKSRTLTELKTRHELPKRLITLLENERHHLAMQLHDEIGEALTALKMDMEKLIEEFGTTQALAERLGGLAGKLSHAVDQVKNISGGLKPRSLDMLGLKPTLRMLVQDLNHHGRFRIDSVFRGLGSRLHGSLELVVYRIVQEALTNVIRHANAKNVLVKVFRAQNGISILVEDDGVGFDPEKVLQNPEGIQGLGLLTIRERAEQLRGKMEVGSRAGGGTSLLVEIPLDGSPFQVADTA